MTPSQNVCRHAMIDVFYKMHHHCKLNYYTKLKTLLFWHLWMWNSFMSRITYDYRSISFMQGKHKLKLSLHTRIWVQETITYQYKFIKNSKHHYEIQNLTKRPCRTWCRTWNDLLSQGHKRFIAFLKSRRFFLPFLIQIDKITLLKCPTRPIAII